MIDYYFSIGGDVVTKRTTNNDGSTIHQTIIKDQDNTDYQSYLAWVAESPDNQPLPADE